MDIVRRSPAGLVFKIILLELFLELIYLFLSALLAEIRGSTGDGYTSARFALSFVFVSLAVSGVVLLVTQWANEGYYLKANELIERRGIVTKTETAYPYANMQSVTVRQGLIGRLFNYGHISIYIPTLGKDIIFSEISNPKQFANKLKQHIPYPDSNQFLLRK